MVYGGKKEEAAENIGLFSDMMRKVLEISGKQEISLQDEMDTLKIYLEMERLRMNDLSFSFSISPDVDLAGTKVPSMIIQPLVENAVKHGLYHKKSDKKLEIRVEKNGASDGVIIWVDDNGIGRKASEEINKRRNKPASFSGHAIHSRIGLLSNLYRKKIILNITDKTDEKGLPAGTLVKLEIPKID